MTLRAGDRKPPDFSGLHEPQRAGNRGKHHVKVSAQEVGHREAGTLVRDVHHIDLRRDLGLPRLPGRTQPMLAQIPKRGDARGAEHRVMGKGLRVSQRPGASGKGIPDDSGGDARGVSGCAASTQSP